VRTLRRRLAAGQVSARQIIGPHGPEWRFQPPPGYQDPAAAPEAGGGGRELIPRAAVEGLLAPYVQQLAALQAELARLQEARLADLARLEAARRQEATAQAQEIGRLEGRLAALQAELARYRETPPDTAPRRRRWPWQR
jgi:hypothetical protein